MTDTFIRLRAPFRWAELEHRQQGKPSAKGGVQMLTYVQRKAIIDRLDEVVGPTNWRDEYELWTGGQAVKCRLHLRTAGEWLAREDVAEESDIEAVKGGVTGAFKRAASKWGVGLYLYEFPTIWLEGNKVGDKVYPPRDADQQILRLVRKEAPRLLHPDDSGNLQPKAPKAQQGVGLIPMTDEPLWLDEELDGGRFSGTRWRWFLEPSEEGGRIGYLEVLIRAPEPSEWSMRAAQCYLFRCTKRWFKPTLESGANLLSIDILSLCKARGLTP